MSRPSQTMTIDRLKRTDWKRHSVPYDFNFDSENVASQVGTVFDQAMEAFTADSVQQRTATIGRDRKKTLTPRLSVYEPRSTVELSTDQYTPGVLKIFGETILTGVQYKSVLASCRSTAQELVKQALERFGLPSTEYTRFVLCDVVGRYEGDISFSSTDTDDTAKSGKWEQLYARILADKDRPLLLQKFWKPIEGFSRRYELHERSRIVQAVDDDDTSGLNQNARKILMSKLRPGAIPMFDASQSPCFANGLSLEYASLMRSDPSTTYQESAESDTSSDRGTQCHEHARTTYMDFSHSIPTKTPFFLNLRGYDVHKDKLVYPVRSKVFSMGSSSSPSGDMPHMCLAAPDVTPIHCKFKVYRFKKSNAVPDEFSDICNYFLEIETVTDNVSVNGTPVLSRAVIKSGDILCLGKYYMLLYKDCSKGFDVPLQLPWFRDHLDNEENGYLVNDVCRVDDEDRSNTDESMDVSIAERMSFAYSKEKEDELVKYICAIIQQQNTARTYPLSAAFLFSMCIEYASKKFERRQLKHLFLRILFTVRENVAESAKALSTNKFTCTFLETAPSDGGRDQTLERLLLWISNCVQLLLFLKHTFQLPEPPQDHPRPGDKKPRGSKSQRKEDNAKHALGQLVTGLEEIIMFCFQQCVYTITKALYPTLSALLDSNPFSEDNCEKSSMEDVSRMYETLAEVTHFVMLHEGITRQLFTYLFFFASTNVFNKLIFEEAGKEYYNWSSGVRVRANLSHLEDWATQNGLEDEFSQMFERLLAAAELLATSRNTLLKYPWSMMKNHYQPLTAGQLYHLLVNYQSGTKDMPSSWVPPPDEMAMVNKEKMEPLSLGVHPPFALPDNCALIDLIRTPEDPSFWSHLRRLRTLYGVAEDDSDSGFSISNTPRCPSLTKQDSDETFFPQQVHSSSESNHSNSSNSASPTRDTCRAAADTVHPLLRDSQRSGVPVGKGSRAGSWSHTFPQSRSGGCKCPTTLSPTSVCEVIEGPGEDDEEDEDSEEEEEDPTALGSDGSNCVHNGGVGGVMKQTSPEESCRESKGIVVPAIPSHSVQVSVSSVQNTDKIAGKPQVHVQPRVVNRNVSNCSARRIPAVSPCQRSKSVTGAVVRASSTAGHSVSMEDLRKSAIRHKPSASFEEAIERGHESDTVPLSGHGGLKARLSSIAEQQAMCKANDSSGESGSSFTQRQCSSLSDEVFEDDTAPECKNGTVKGTFTLPSKNSFKPNGVSVITQKQSLEKVAHLNPQSSIPSTRTEPDNTGLSLKLSKGRLLPGRNGFCKGQTDSHNSDSLPTNMLVEVSANTLASKKRQCTSLNVIPDTDSPRTLQKEQAQEQAELEEHKKMSPCPLFTVYLRKGSGGLGLGLIDGLHTPLRLAGIYIRRILPDSPAAVNGCLQVGDRILAVSNKSVIGADYQSTMNLIREAGDTLTLLVARGNESMARKVSASPV